MQQIHHLDPADYIQKGCRLIEQDDRTLLGQRLCDHHLLPLSIGELGHIILSLVADTGCLHRLLDDSEVLPIEPTEKTGIGMPSQSHQLPNP